MGATAPDPKRLRWGTLNGGQVSREVSFGGTGTVPRKVIIVAVVRSFLSNHRSEYFRAKVWNTDEETPESA